ncbi:MAG: NAD-binding protein, partial [Limnochordia bacterium]
MRVIVVGAGEVGYFIAAKLSEEGQDVVVIDQCPQALEKVGENLDVLTVLGSGGHASVLERAGAKEADLLIAVTETDEVNMISCLLGKRFGVKETVARVSSDDFPAGNMFTRNELGIDLMINPEELVAAEILKLLKTPLATEVDYFAHGKVEMVGYRVPEGAKLVDSQLKNLPFPPDCLVVAIARHNDVIIPQGGDHIKAHDIIYVLGPRGNSSKLLWLLGGGQGVIKKVMIVG